MAEVDFKFIPLGSQFSIALQRSKVSSGTFQEEYDLILRLTDDQSALVGTDVLKIIF